MELARTNLIRVRELLHRFPLRRLELAALWQRGADGSGAVLRLSPERTVLRVDGAAGGSWVLKLHHPRRRAEGLRRLLSPAPALREARLAAQLGLGRWLAEQPSPAVGVLARPWQERHPPGDWARGLRGLHDRGWSDPDLSADDLLWNDRGQLVPLDLGHARFTPGGAPLLARRADCLLLLSGLDEREAEAAATRLHGEYRSIFPPVWGVAELLAEARRVRAARHWRHSRRCLRACSDFEPHGGGARRRGFASVDDAGEELRRSTRTTVTRRDGCVEKEYLRAGPWQRVRLAVGRGPARLAYRRLYCLELQGRAAARVLAWSPTARGERLVTEWIDGRPAAASDVPLLAGFLADLHGAGIGLRDAKAANFRVLPDGSPVLIDGDGLRFAAPRRARDLGRLLAELPAGDPRLADAWEGYASGGGPPPAGATRRAAQAEARRFRAILARAAPG